MSKTRAMIPWVGRVSAIIFIGVLQNAYQEQEEQIVGDHAEAVRDKIGDFVSEQAKVGISSTMSESNVALTRTSPKFVLRKLPSPPKKRSKRSSPQASTAAFAQGAP